MSALSEYRHGRDHGIPAAGRRKIQVFVFAGYEPATDLVRGTAECDERGYIVTDRLMKTSCEGLYAAGDVCIKPLRQVVTAVGDGALAATELERYAAAMQKRQGFIRSSHRQFLLESHRTFPRKTQTAVARISRHLYSGDDRTVKGRVR